GLRLLLGVAKVDPLHFILCSGILQGDVRGQRAGMRRIVKCEHVRSPRVAKSTLIVCHLASARTVCKAVMKSSARSLLPCPYAPRYPAAAVTSECRRCRVAPSAVCVRNGVGRRGGWRFWLINWCAP